MTHVRAHTRRKAGVDWSVRAVGPKGKRIDIDSKPADRVVFDDLFVDAWLRCEQMDTRHWWLRVADLMIDVHLRGDGSIKVCAYRDVSPMESVIEHVAKGPWWRTPR